MKHFYKEQGMKRFVFPVVMACLLSAGCCASTSENLQRETARVIGDISPDQVKVSISSEASQSTYATRGLWE
jgi:hypothetical protein